MKKGMGLSGAAGDGEQPRWSRGGRRVLTEAEERGEDEVEDGKMGMAARRGDGWCCQARG